MSQKPKSPKLYLAIAWGLITYSGCAFVVAALHLVPWVWLFGLAPNIVSIYGLQQAHTQTRHTERHLRTIESYTETILATIEEKAL